MTNNRRIQPRYKHTRKGIWLATGATLFLLYKCNTKDEPAQVQPTPLTEPWKPIVPGTNPRVLQSMQIFTKIFLAADILPSLPKPTPSATQEIFRRGTQDISLTICSAVSGSLDIQSIQHFMAVTTTGEIYYYTHLSQMKSNPDLFDSAFSDVALIREIQSDWSPELEHLVHNIPGYQNARVHFPGGLDTTFTSDNSPGDVPLDLNFGSAWWENIQQRVSNTSFANMMDQLSASSSPEFLQWSSPGNTDFQKILDYDHWAQSQDPAYLKEDRRWNYELGKARDVKIREIYSVTHPCQ